MCHCKNYDETTMGIVCDCEDCKACTILNYSRMGSKELVQKLCCQSERGTKLLCAEGKCLTRNCGANKYRGALFYGKGCHTFNGNLDFEVEYKRVQKCKSDEKEYKYIIHDVLPWTEFMFVYLDVLKGLIHHMFSKQRQNGQRKIICRNGTISLHCDQTQCFHQLITLQIYNYKSNFGTSINIDYI